MRARLSASAALGLGLLLAAPQLASANPTALFICKPITQPGSYVLARSIVTAADVCFAIMASNVKLDLGGHTLTGQDGTNNGTQQAVTDNGVMQTGVEVTNGAITGFRRAIELDACEGCKISWLRIDTNGDGINVGPSALVYKNIVTNSDDDGLKAERGSIIKHNVSNFNNSEGISAEKNSIVKNNATESNGGDGLNIQCPTLVVQNISRQNGTNYNEQGSCTEVDNVGF